MQDIIWTVFIFLASLLSLVVVIILWLAIFAVVIAVIIDIKDDNKGGLL